jgi:molecular chaperone GrpE
MNDTPHASNNLENVSSPQGKSQNQDPLMSANVQPDAMSTDQPVDPTVALLELLTRTENERDELKDRLLRTLAEMENLRRRTEREVSDARTYAVTNFAKDMMNVSDNIRRALENVPVEAISTMDGALKGLIEGIELTERDLLKTFERHGIRQVNPMGEKFDPNLHQAMFEVPDPSIPHGHVMNVAQIGYAIGDRVLRPALVGVARGGAKAPPPAPEEPGIQVA